MSTGSGAVVKGIDGRIYFHVGDGQTRQIILSVKAGHVTVSQVRDLRGVLDREGADMGVLISVEEPTAHSGHRDRSVRSS
jgi:site-specific DNA-methyltransferase (adenine-specific)